MPRDLDTDLLRAFTTLVDAGGFTLAAERLNCTQSAVSMRIKRLEGIIRDEIVVRSNKGISLTASGERLLDHARNIVMLNDEAVEFVFDRRRNGVVRIGLMEDYASVVLPPLIKRFMASYPNISIEAHAGLTPLKPKHVGRTYDLVLTMELPNTCNGEVLCKEQPVWARAEHMALTHDVIPIALYPRDCILGKLMLGSLRQAGREWRVAYHSHSIAAVQSVVKEGIAIGVFKKSTLSEQLAIVPDESGLPEMQCVDIVLHRAAGLKRSSPANLFADFLVSAMHSDPIHCVTSRSARRRPSVAAAPAWGAIGCPAISDRTGPSHSWEPTSAS